MNESVTDNVKSGAGLISSGLWEGVNLIEEKDMEKRNGN